MIPRDTAPAPAPRRAAKFALLAATLVLLVIGLEVGTRLFTHTVRPLKENDPILGQRYLRSFQGKVYVPEAERKILLRFNNQGFRGPDRPLAKPAGVRRLALVGDSMIASIEVEEPDTVACRLERLLNQSAGERWEVLNFGLSGSSPGQELVLYRNLVARYQPDIVVQAFFAGNDLTDNSCRLSNHPRIYFDVDAEGRLRQMPFSPRGAVLSQYLNRYSRFYVWQKDMLSRARANWHEKAGVLPAREWAVYCTREDDDVAQAWRISGALAKAFHREAEAHGSRYVQMLIPAARQIYGDSFRELVAASARPHGELDPDHPDRRLGRLCREAGVPFFSLTPAFRAAAPARSVAVKTEWLYYHGQGHFNSRGSEVAAASLFCRLTQSTATKEPLVALKPGAPARR